jgi:hypothetical protein
MIPPRISIRSLLFFVVVVAIGLTGLVYPDWTWHSVLHLVTVVILLTALLCTIMNLNRPRSVGVFIFGIAFYILFAILGGAPPFALPPDMASDWLLKGIHPASLKLQRGTIARDNLEQAFPRNVKLLFILIMSAVGGIIGETIGQAQANQVRRGREERAAGN